MMRKIWNFDITYTLKDVKLRRQWREPNIHYFFFFMFIILRLSYGLWDWINEIGMLGLAILPLLYDSNWSQHLWIGHHLQDLKQAINNNNKYFKIIWLFYRKIRCSRQISLWWGRFCLSAGNSILDADVQ